MHSILALLGTESCACRLLYNVTTVSIFARASALLSVARRVVTFTAVQPASVIAYRHVALANGSCPLNDRRRSISDNAETNQLLYRHNQADIESLRFMYSWYHLYGS